MLGEVNIALQIGAIAVASGAALSPVATCLKDTNWYSSGSPTSSTTTSATPTPTGTNNSKSSAYSNAALLGILSITIFVLREVFSV